MTQSIHIFLVSAVFFLSLHLCLVSLCLCHPFFYFLFHFGYWFSRCFTFASGLCRDSDSLIIIFFPLTFNLICLDFLPCYFLSHYEPSSIFAQYCRRHYCAKKSWASLYFLRYPLLSLTPHLLIFMHSFSVRFLYNLTNLSLISLFPFLKSGFLTAALPLRLILMKVQWTVDALTEESDFSGPVSVLYWMFPKKKTVFSSFVLDSNF